LKLALLAVMTLPGAPCIYYGDEIGMEGYRDPDCRRAFPWDVSHWNRELLDFTKAAAALRNGHPTLRHGDFRVLASVPEYVVYALTGADETLVVVLNASDSSTQVTLTPDLFDGRHVEPIPLPTLAAAQANRAGEGTALTVGA